MLSDILLWLLIVAFIAACVIAFIVAPIMIRRDNKKRIQEIDRDGEEPEAEPTSVDAVVVDKRIDEGYVGGNKLPNYTAVFILAFKTENGEIKEFSVAEEIYCRCYKKQKGTLVTLNGNFFDFGDGE